MSTLPTWVAMVLLDGLRYPPADLGIANRGKGGETI